jgi:isoquinoline 1-oxidoreductase beta subunit
MIPDFLLGRGPRGPVQIHNLSRRSFLKQVGLASSGLVLGLSACSETDDAANSSDAGDAGESSQDQGSKGSSADGGAGKADGSMASKASTASTKQSTDASAATSKSAQSEVDFTELDTFVSIGSDGTIRVTVHRSEMGQGVRTALAMLVADELGASWKDVKVTQANGDMRYGDQNTDGSSTIRLNWEPLRKAGAAAREMLLGAAAKKLDVSVSELRAEDSAVKHEGSGRSLRFAELAEEAAKLEVPSSPKLKEAGQRSIIGRGTAIIDGHDVVTGKAVYGIDVEVPGMLHASLERSPTLGGKIKSYDKDAALAVAGVRDVVEIAGDGQNTNAAIAVIADNTWAAMSGRTKLAAQWDTGGAELEQTEKHRAMLSERVMMDGKVALEVGDMDNAMTAAARVIDVQYSSPYLSHSPLEPLVAVADVREDRAEIWAPTQNPIGARGALATLLKLGAESITVHVTLLGGGFGRKSQSDFVLEAAAVSRAVGKPVKVTWTREDEIHHGFYRPENRQRLRATLDDKDTVTGVTGHSVFSTIAKAFRATAIDPIAAELQMGWTNPPYRLPNLRLSATGVPSGLRIGWWRSVCNTFHAFAWSSFIDELAAETKRNPLDFYKSLVGKPGMVGSYDTARLLAVVDKVAGMGLWGKEVPKGEGVGFAAHMSFQSYVACVMHVAVTDKKQITLKQVDYAIDCGTVVNPDGVRAQCEGGLVFGLSAALFGEITVKDGAVVQSNFHDYPLLRMEKMPKVNVEIIESSASPTGIGEPPTPVVAPALTNAIFAATGTRERDLPLSAKGYS